MPVRVVSTFTVWRRDVGIATSSSKMAFYLIHHYLRVCVIKIIKQYLHTLTIREMCDSGPPDGTARLKLLSGAGICALLIPCRRSRKCHGSFQELTYNCEVVLKTTFGHYMTPGASDKIPCTTRHSMQRIYYREPNCWNAYSAPPTSYIKPTKPWYTARWAAAEDD